MQTNKLKVIYDKYRENKLAHAYLIETNNINCLLNDLKELIKALNCPFKYNSFCSTCNLCNLIEKNNLPSIITITPDGAYIKKNQIEELKISFETKPIYSKYNIYIILNAEKLNHSSANAMLKFVEEPTEGILGFFITTNKDIIIPTIKSRCQSYVILYETEDILAKINIDQEKLESNLSDLKEYLSKIASNNYINHKEFILSKYPDRKDIEILFTILLNAYEENLNKLLHKNKSTLPLSSLNITDNLEFTIKKMNILSKFLQDLSYNGNIELLLDKFVIEMRSIHE